MTGRRVLLLTALVLAGFGMSACSGGDPSAQQSAVVSADYPSYDSVKSLGSVADLIVEVTLGEPRNGVLLPQYEGDDPALNPAAGAKEQPDPKQGAVPITLFDASVIDVFRGDAAPGEMIQVMQPGGVQDGVHYVVEGMTRLKAGSTVLLFLSTYPDSPASILGGDVGAFVAGDDGFASLAGELVVTEADLESFLAN